MIKRLLLNRIALATLLVITLLPITTTVQSQELPLVTGVSYDGQVISWEPLEGALGYDIYAGPQYSATVVGITSYRPEVLGSHSIVAFDGSGSYSPILPEDRGVPRSNSVVIDELAQGVNQPANVTGTVYSVTAGELFWDPVPSRNLGYRVFVNGEFSSFTDGTSGFVNRLLPDSVNLVSVVASTSTGESSEAVVLEFDTRADTFPIEATLTESDTTDTGTTDPDSTPALLPESPQNVTLIVYGPNSAELFWDRTTIAENIVSTDIIRDGELIGSAEGSSFFDGTGSFNFGRIIDVPHTYELIAIDGNGARSVPAIVNPGAFDPGAFDDSNNSINQRLLQGIVEVTSNNPHLQWFPTLQSIANGEAPDSLQEISVEPVVTEGVLQFTITEFNCINGSLTLQANSAVIGTSFLTFNQCQLENGNFDGSFSLVGLDAGGYTASYDNLFIDLIDFPVDMNGDVSLSIGRASGSKALSYTDFRYGFIGNLLDDDGLDTVVTLNQQVADTVIDQPRHFFETNFTVSAPFTNGEELTITTNERFEGVIVSDESGLPNYTSGQLTAETGNGEQLSLIPDPRDMTRYLSTVLQDGSAQTFSGFWGDAVRLPCISATPEDESITGCPF